MREYSRNSKKWYRSAVLVKINTRQGFHPIGATGLTMKKITLKTSDSAITASQTFSGLGFKEQPESVSERVRKWYIDPLRQMSGSQGFLVLMVLFPLYEKHLRNKHSMKGDFTEGHLIFRVVGGIWGLVSKTRFDSGHTFGTDYYIARPQRHPINSSTQFDPMGNRSRKTGIYFGSTHSP